MQIYTTDILSFAAPSGKRGFTEHKKEELDASVTDRRDTILPITIVSTTQLCMVSTCYTC